MTKTKVIRGDDIVAAPPVYVAKSELTLGEPELQAILDRLGLEYLLINYWGFDGNHIADAKTQCFYEESYCEFRSRTGKIVTDVRYTGVERLDDEWLLEGNPSKAAQEAARKDLSYLREIGKLGRRVKSL